MDDDFIPGFARRNMPVKPDAILPSGGFLEEKTIKTKPFRVTAPKRSLQEKRMEEAKRMTTKYENKKEAALAELLKFAEAKKEWEAKVRYYEKQLGKGE